LFCDSIAAVAKSLDRHVGLNVATRVWAMYAQTSVVLMCLFWFQCSWGLTRHYEVLTVRRANFYQNPEIN